MQAVCPRWRVFAAELRHPLVQTAHLGRRINAQQLVGSQMSIKNQAPSSSRLASGVPATAPPIAAEASASLWHRIVERYDCAQKEAAATMTDTHTEVVEDGGIEFLLRVAARLRDKPKPPTDKGGKLEWRNPFLPYEPALWVADLGNSHVLLLNKFNIVPWHCLVVTSTFQHQEDDLNADDFEATWKVMQSMPCGGLGFYNCGKYSGASQPHKHVQIVPLPLNWDSNNSSGSGNDVAGTLARPPIWPAVAAVAGTVAAGELLELRSLPFAAFAAVLDVPSTGAGTYLSGVYQRLLERCHSLVEAKTGQQAVDPHGGSLSYNLVLTSEFMMLVPRRAVGDGPVSCNSVAFAGSMFVKGVEELQYVKQAGPLHILTAAGYQW